MPALRSKQTENKKKKAKLAKKDAKKDLGKVSGGYESPYFPKPSIGGDKGPDPTVLDTKK